MWPRLLGLGAALIAAHTQLVDVGGATIEVQLARDLPDAALLRWVDTSARAVAGWYGRFPVRRARLEIAGKRGGGVGHGTTFPSREIDLVVGKRVTAAELADDWVLTHEMVHLGFPSLPDRHHWMEEGLATYVEPIARARAGALSDEKIWGDLIVGLPQGLPQEGDRGLDATPTWGRTYWGGCLFWLLADVGIRERTGNQKGLEHALRAIVAAGGTVDADWSAEQVIAAGDRATGVPVLRELYDRMKAAPAPVDLDALWKRLGVSLRDGAVRFDDGAPLASVRRAITKRETLAN
jgi:hypothetical protein